MPRVLRRVLCFLCALVLQLGHAAPPSEISNEATVQYSPTGTEGIIAIRSGTVRATIDYTPQFALMGEQRQTATRGQSIALAHRLVNQGAQPLLFRLFTRARADSGFEPSALHIFNDLNHNGVIDVSEPEITESDSIPVDGHEEISLLVRVAIPSAVTGAQSASIAVMAREVVTDLQQMRIDTIDVAAPATSPIGLFIEKTVSRTEVEIGETVDYTIRVKNITSQSLSAVDLTSSLQFGFTYVPGSLRIGTDNRTAPTLSASALGILIGNLAPGEQIVITYSTRVTSAALVNSSASRAWATALGASSNMATTVVRIRQGSFTTKAVIIGRVFVDTNANGLLDPDEPGIPGVRLFLEDGTSALTDGEGKYSFYGLSPRTHVIKVDATTLPTGARLAIISNDQAGNAGSQFANLKNYELHKTNFALTAPSAETLAEITSRRTALRHPTAEITRELSGRLTADGLPTPIADPKSLPSSGVIKADGDSTFPTVAERSSKTTPAAAVSKAVAADNFDVLAGVTNSELGFVNLRDGAVLPIAQTDVWLKAPTGSRFALAVNGAVIGEDQVGTKATVADRNLEAWNFVGVNLNPGDNRLRATLLDPFGNTRGTATIHVIAPGTLATIKVTPPEHAVADGSTITFVSLELLDAQGTPVTARTPITLETSRGQWRVEDLDPATPGTQVFIEGGRGSFPLVPPLDPGESELRISSGATRAESTVMFEPNLRPMLANGVIEGTFNLGSRSKGSIFPIGARDAFEQELRSLSANSSDGRLNAGARAAFFLKGKIRGDYLLTAAYDSDKADQERLFRDIQPGEFYPVYGDASERGFDAQSTGRLYVRLDHQRSYLLLGDFTTAAASAGTDSAQSLGNYQRSLTGAKEHYETDRITANLWASQDSTSQVIRELRADGTSGPYDFAAAEITPNSERVELITRDRDQPSRIIETRTLARFLDYEFEPVSGHLLLRAPAPSVDANLNPISIRITAEVDQGGAKFWVYGGDAHVKVTPRVQVGGSYLRNENLTDAGNLASADASYNWSDKTKLVTEVARSESATGGEGWAERIDFKHQDDRIQAHAYLGRTDVAFNNPGALLLPGRVDGGLRFNYKLTSTTTLLTQGIVSESLANGTRLRGIQADVERAFGPWRFAIGGRHSEQSSISGDTTIDSLRAKVTAPVPHFAGASIFGEYERDVRYGRELAAVGFDKAFTGGGRAYGRHEFITSLGGPFELDQNARRHTTVFGLDRPYMKDGQVFNEYRADNEIVGREAEAATGLRNLWRIADGIRANTSFERVTPITGAARDESTSVTGSIEYAVDPRWRANARLELRESTSTDSLLNTLGYARLLDRDWTLLGKTIFLVSRSKGAVSGQTVQGRGQIGLAWRPARFDRWNALVKYELKYESDNRPAASLTDRLTQIFSGDLNYQPDMHWILTSHYAGKWVEETRPMYRGSTMAHLLGQRVAYAINRRWDVGLNASVLFSEKIDQGRLAFGPEVGVLLGKNLNLGFGFNFTGFRDTDFAADGSTARGAFVRLRFKFDETLLPGRTEPSSP